MRFAEKTRYVFVLAAACVIWTASVEGFTIPRTVGNKWIYTDKTVTIMQEHDDGGVTWSGFTTYPEPEALDPGVWHKDSLVWEETANNWITVVMTATDTVVQFKNTLLVSATDMLKIPAPDVGGMWMASVPPDQPVQFTFVDTQTIAVPAGVFFCCKVMSELTKLKVGTGSWTISTTTWWADGIGIVKDSTHITDNEQSDECADFRLSKLIRYEFK